MSMINTKDILETIKMIEEEHLDIRTITMGISLRDLAADDINVLADKVYDKVTRRAEKLVATGEQIERELGIPIINKRISVTPIAMVGATSSANSYVPLSDLLDRAAETTGVNFVGGFSALVQKGFAKGDEILINSIPEAMAETNLVCSSVNVASTKAGVNMMSKMLAAEWGPYGVRSNCVEPCFVKTPMSANFYADPEVEKSRSRLIATRRIGEVSDIANAVMFLASKRSDFTTGDAIKVDGGFSNMMGDLTAKPGGRRAYADNYLKNKGVELWSDESGVAKPTDQ